MSHLRSRILAEPSGNIQGFDPDSEKIGSSNPAAASNMFLNSRNMPLSWSYGVTVSTLDPESSDRGSNPRETFCVPQTWWRHVLCVLETM